jgi:hypothetical protein
MARKAQVAAVDVNWKCDNEFKEVSLGSFRYCDKATLPAGMNIVPLKNNIANADPAIQKKQIIEYLMLVVSTILNRPPIPIDKATPLSAMGIDSLASIQIRNRVFVDLGLNVEVQELMSDACISELAATLQVKMSKPLTTLNDQIGADQIDELLKKTEKMTEKEIDELLKQITE